MNHQTPTGTMITQVDSDLDVTAKVTAPTMLIGEDGKCCIKVTDDNKMLITLPTDGKANGKNGTAQEYDMRSIIESIQELNRRTATFNCNISFTSAMDAFDTSAISNDMFACDQDEDGLPAAQIGEVNIESANSLYNIPLVATDHENEPIYTIREENATNSITMGLNNIEMKDLYGALGSVHTQYSGTITTHKLELSNDYIAMVKENNILNGDAEFFTKLTDTPYRYGFDGDRIILIYYGKGAFYLDIPTKQMKQISDLKYVYDIYKTNLTISGISVPVYILAALRTDNNSGNIVLCPTIQILDASFTYITAWKWPDTNTTNYIIGSHTFAEAYLPRMIEINRTTVNNDIHIRTPVQYADSTGTFIRIYLTTFKFNTDNNTISLSQVSGTYHTNIVNTSFNTNNLKWLDYGYTLTNGDTIYYIYNEPSTGYNLTTIDIKTLLNSTLIEHTQCYNDSFIFSLMLLKSISDNSYSIKYIIRARNSVPNNATYTNASNFPFPIGFQPNYSGVRVLAVERGNSDCFIVFTGNGIFRCEISSTYNLTVTSINSDLTDDDKLLALIYNSDGYVYAISDKRVIKCIYKSLDKTIVTSTMDEVFDSEAPIDAMDVGFLYNKAPYSIKEIPIIPKLNYISPTPPPTYIN